MNCTLSHYRKKKTEYVIINLGMYNDQ